MELADARGTEDPAPLGCEIEGGGRGRAGEVRLSLRGVERREGAEALRGRLVLIEASALPPASEGEIYGYELVGCQVELPSGECVGRVREIWDARAHDAAGRHGSGRARSLDPVRSGAPADARRRRAPHRDRGPARDSPTPSSEENEGDAPDRRDHDLSGAVRGVPQRRACWAVRSSAGSWRSPRTTSGPSPRTGTARWTTSRTAAARGW